MALTLTITNAGRVALVNAANTGTAPVTIAQIGLSGAAVTPVVTATALPGEFKRLATLSGDVVADDTIHLIVRDESADVFTVRSLAMYLADGTLFGIYGQAAVLVEKSAQALMLIAVDVKFEDIAASAITFGDANFLNPPATTERQGVVELSTVAEAQAGIDALRALTPATAKAAILGWLLTQDGSGSGLDADLLDGQDGAYYTNITARLGYTPVNKAGDTMSGGLTITNGAGFAQLLPNGDILAARAGGTAGLLYLNSAGNRYLYNDGSVYHLSGQQLNVNGFVSWNAGNDGAGSGLDADLLDGQDSSYYTNITARLGYTPANRAGDTFLGSVTVVPGASMGVNASAIAGGIILAPGDATHTGLLSLYQPNGTRLGYVGYATNGNRMNYASDNGTGHSFVGGWLYRDSYVVWDAGNDGAGSGLDADLLDGQDSGYYVNITARLGYTPVNKAGDTMSGALAVSDGAGMSRLWPNGDSTLYRSGGVSGCLYLNAANNRYLFNNGSAYELAGQQLYVNGSVSWNAGNDGAGSGLDADLLDGQDGSYYSNITARLGYTPANRAGDTFLGSVTVVPGASMGVNASAIAGGTILAPGDATHTGLLSLYQPNGTRLGYVGYATNGSRMNYVSENGTGHSFINGWIYRDGNVAWDAGNDGSGSGLDADLLDGYQAADFLRVTSNLIEVGGRRVHSDGYIEHWGKILFRRTGEVGFRFDFPTAFPNECFGVHFTTINSTGHYDGDSHLQEVVLDRLGINIFLQSDTGGQQDYQGFRWFARGR